VSYFAAVPRTAVPATKTAAPAPPGSLGWTQAGMSAPCPLGQSEEQSDSYRTEP
jgi:uncharacterized membrane protein YbhN (UPF0104 family)